MYQGKSDQSWELKGLTLNPVFTNLETNIIEIMLVLRLNIYNNKLDSKNARFIYQYIN